MRNLQSKIKTPISQINPIISEHVDSNRKRPGLINALGSIILSIIENLEVEDAEKYDRIIRNIINEQTNNNQSPSVYSRICIWKIQPKYLPLAHNQELIRAKILQIEQYILNVGIE